MKRVLVIQHVAHEGLGMFAEPLTQAGCVVTTLNAANPDTIWPLADEVQGIVIMGGPMAVYERHRHPCLIKELHFLRNALQQEVPVLGICLGAQLIAHALGAQVTKNPQQEIGWYPLTKAPGAASDPLLAAFAATETVFQWHGDTFTLPRESVQLASSPLCAQQAFRYRDNVYGLQFHVEVTDTMIQEWLDEPGNARELSGVRDSIDPAAIRRASSQHLPRLHTLAHHVATAWCASVTPAPSAHAHG